MAQLDEDTMVMILENFIWIYGSWTNSHVLVVNSRLTTRLYPAFYTNLAILTFKAIFALRKTLQKYRERTFYERRDHFGYFLSHHHIDLICDLITQVAGQLKRLTLVTHERYPKLQSRLEGIILPELEELEAPAHLVCRVNDGNHGDVFNASCRWPSLRKLRILYITSVPASALLLRRQDYRPLTSLTHLYIGYCAESPSQVREFISRIRVAPQVQAIAVEMNGGYEIPFVLQDLANYEFHPRMVFVFRAGRADRLDYWAQRELEEEIATWNTSPRKISWTRRQVMDKGLWVDTDVIGMRSLWKEVDGKVLARWKEVKRFFNDRALERLTSAEEPFVAMTK
ncbi:hypothetical protein MPER_13249 [Moniliophthora perniciosa FA553]|nr:hypothetical protein MPER_13249 [Moniliophthora perniciosa FA553]